MGGKSAKEAGDHQDDGRKMVAVVELAEYDIETDYAGHKQIQGQDGKYSKEVGRK